MRELALIFGSVLSLVLSIGVARAENVDPDESGAQYAWSENAGWVNLEPGGNAGNGMQVADFAVTGWMWSENAGWISLSCQNTASCGTVSYGVTNDGHGHFDGRAWGENVGWDSFQSASGAVTADPVSGKIAGKAWGENVGWITLASAKTSWCQSTPSVPTGGPDVRAKRVGFDVELSQLTIAGGASWHEIVRGSLGTLRASGGDFTAAMLDCAGDNVTTATLVVPGTPVPASGDGYWYLARGANCKGKGSYDTLSIDQIGSRDAEIAASGAACP